MRTCSWTMRKVTALYLAVLAMGIGPSWSQDTSQVDQWDDTVVDLHFPGGTVRDYIEALAASYRPTSENLAGVIYSDQAARVSIPSVFVTNVTIHRAIKLLEQIADDADGVYIERETDDYDRNTIYVIKANSTSVPRTIGIYSVAYLKDETERNSLLKALELGMMLNESQNVQVKIHQETNLLFVRGTPDELHIAEQIVAQAQRSFDAVR